MPRLVVDIIRVKKALPPRQIVPLPRRKQLRPLAAARKTAKTLFTAFTGIAFAAASLALAAAFEAHVMNVTALIEHRQCDSVADFDRDASGNPILPGERIDDQYSAWGLTVFVKQTSSIEPDPDHPSIAFDSANPTGGQFDLGTTNENFAGPGVGAGGGVGMPGENNKHQDNVVVVADNTVDENHDTLIDDPKSKDELGKLMFIFTQPTNVYSLRLVDIDEQEVFVKLFDRDRNQFATVTVPALGDNSAQTVDLSAFVDRAHPMTKAIKVAFKGSGGADELCFDKVETQADHIVINEVYYDTGNRGQGANREDEITNEWIELYNPTSNPVNLKNWKVTDNSGTLRTISTSNRTLFPGQYAVLSKAASTFTFWDIPASALKIQLGENIGNGLANDGDRVILEDDLGNEVDSMSYGTDTAELNPSVPDVAEGRSTTRHPDGFDTDQASDWRELETPTPGSGYGHTFSGDGGLFSAYEEFSSFTAEALELAGGGEGYTHENETDEYIELSGEDEPTPPSEESIIPPAGPEEAATGTEDSETEDSTQDVPTETVPPADVPLGEVSVVPESDPEPVTEEPTPISSPETTPPPAETAPPVETPSEGQNQETSDSGSATPPPPPPTE